MIDDWHALNETFETVLDDSYVPILPIPCAAQHTALML